MRRAVQHAPAGQWPRGQDSASVTLDFDARHRRRMRLPLDGGAEFLLDLPKAVAMAEGDGLYLDDGSWIAVKAAAEPVLDIRIADRRALMRIAWHLGNRHLPTEIHADGLRIRPDHVIEEMLRRLGASVEEIRAPFQPEGGAYGGHGAQPGAHDHDSHGQRHHHHGHDHHH